jgi:hypothetical protein
LRLILMISAQRAGSRSGTPDVRVGLRDGGRFDRSATLTTSPTGQVHVGAWRSAVAAADRPLTGPAGCQAETATRVVAAQSAPIVASASSMTPSPDTAEKARVHSIRRATKEGLKLASRLSMRLDGTGLAAPFLARWVLASVGRDHAESRRLRRAHSRRGSKPRLRAGWGDVREGGKPWAGAIRPTAVARQPVITSSRRAFPPRCDRYSLGDGGDPTRRWFVRLIHDW